MCKKFGLLAFPRLFFYTSFICPVNISSKNFPCFFVCVFFIKFKFSSPYLYSARKCIQISTNKPSIGILNVRKLFKNFFCMYSCKTIMLTYTRELCNFAIRGAIRTEGLKSQNGNHRIKTDSLYWQIILWTTFLAVGWWVDFIGHEYHWSLFLH